MTSRWIEIAADYRCNLRCLGCSAVPDGGPAMTTSAVARVLTDARRAGAEHFWFGGGEPTRRPDFVKILRVAARAGYRTIKVQTHGLLFAAKANVERAVAAGMNEVNLTVRGPDAASHDGLVGAAGAFDRLLVACDALRAASVPTEADILVSARNVALVPATVERFAALGVRRFNLWHLSLFGLSETMAEKVATELPTMAAAAAATSEAIVAAMRHPSTPAVRALHLPPCVLPRKDWPALFQAAAHDLEVVDPGGHRFRLEQSPFEGGVYLPRCHDCAARAVCDGLREDYLAHHGDEEFQPIEGVEVPALPPWPPAARGDLHRAG